MKEPLIAMLAFICALFAFAFCARMYAVLTRRISLDHYKIFAHQNEPDYLVRITNNLNNQFQLPVLFICAGVVVVVLKMDEQYLVFNAWAFVACRVAHSIIHLTFNAVLARSAIFAAGLYFLCNIWYQIYLRI